ncbi:MAG: exopolysaccharide biosynthesis protein [Pseudomonadota bacterium]
MSDSPQSASDIIAKLGKLDGDDKRDGDAVQIGEVIKTIGGRSYGPLLLLPALLGASPLGGIPTVPSVLAVIIAVIAAQMVIGRTHFWLPGFLAERTVPKAKLESARETLSKPAQLMDTLFDNRLSWATKEPMPRIAAVLVLILCLTIAPLELVPFAAILPFSAIAAFGLAMTVRDGALMLLALALSCTSVGLVFYALLA